MRDPYDVLGVPRKASAEQIKAAFRRLAKNLHPDANKNDAKAAARFAELNAAYEILGEEDKRKAFDRGEIDAEGKPRFQGFGGFGAGRPGGSDADTVFETFTWGPEGMRRARGGPGGRRGFQGLGGIEDILSDMFGGFGGAAGAGPQPAGGFRAGPGDLAGEPGGGEANAALTITLEEAAKGARKRVRLPTGKEVEVRVPKGLTDGKQIRLKGQGFPRRGGAGDALITVSIAPHPVFRVDGKDLRIEMPVTLYEAALGAKIRVPTLDGAVDLAVPAGTSGGRIFRLKGKGLPASGGAGDLLAAVRIVLPDRADAEFEELMRKWRAQRPYDPRREIG